MFFKSREVELTELQSRQQGFVLRLVGEPLERALHARLHLGPRQAFDAGQERGQLCELARARGVADLRDLRLDRAAIEIRHQLQSLLICHGETSWWRDVSQPRRSLPARSAG